MSKWVFIPSSVEKDDRWSTLSPEAKRAYVTGWAICDESGVVSQSLYEQAYARWGCAVGRDDRIGLRDILEDMERLGFCRRVERDPKRPGYRFRRSGGWLS